MLEKIFAKFGLKEDESRKIYLLLVALFLGIALMFMSKNNDVGTENSSVGDKIFESEIFESESYTSQNFLSENENLSAEEQLEQRLEEILSKIAGAGQVDVTLIFAQSGTTEYAVTGSASSKTSVENDGVNSQETFEESTNSDLVLASGEPVALSQSVATVQGVLVVAEGGENATVCADITAALSNLLAVAVHKIVICTAASAYD